MSLEYLVQCEKKNKCSKNFQKRKQHSQGYFQRYIQREFTGRVPNGQSENNLKMKIYKVVLDFNPKCNKNTTSPY